MRVRKAILITIEPNDKLREFPLGPLVHDWRREGELIH